MPKCHRNMLFHGAPRYTKLGRDLGMRYTIDPVSAEHAHRTLGRSGEQRGQALEMFSPRDRIECGRRIIDRLDANDHGVRLDISRIPTLATPGRANPVKHDVHADPVQVGQRVGDRAGRHMLGRLADVKPDFLHDVLGLRNATGSTGEESNELRTMRR